MTPAVAYARFSSEMQREESIDAQIRAIKYYAAQSGYDIINIYTDKAKTGRNADRPNFMKMIADSSKREFQAVIVHKLDRFSRNSADALYYERQLNINGVTLISVNEKLDNTPEGALMKMVITGMNEFYSKNLAREVMKGLKENAYQCKTTGGRSPLGYDIGHDMRYKINEREAEAVRLIFKMYDEGAGYSEILKSLNEQNYKTKVGKPFGKNSLYEILKNEKYTGTYIFNKSISKSVTGSFNRHKYKDDKDIIRIENGIPAIIDQELFERVQNKMKLNATRHAQHKAKAFYLLSGKLYCGHCGGAMTGETRRYRDREYAYYVCSSGKRTHSCDKKPIDKNLIEKMVIEKLNNNIFAPEIIDEICKRISEICKADNGIEQKISQYKSDIAGIDIKINNLCKAIESGLDMQVASDRVNALNEEKNDIRLKMVELESVPNAQAMTLEEMKEYFHKYGNIANLTLQQQKTVVNRFVDKILVYDDPEGYKVRILINTQKVNVSDFLDSNGNNLPLPIESKNDMLFFANGILLLDFFILKSHR